LQSTNRGVEDRAAWKKTAEKYFLRGAYPNNSEYMQDPYAIMKESHIAYVPLQFATSGAQVE
jgi:hypothetical protein